MGLIFSYCFGHTREAIYRIEEEAQQQPKTYSWDKQRLDPAKFMFDNLQKATEIKGPSEINGQQFIIQNCKKSNLFLFDQSASVTVDDCTDCNIFIGPCKGSVFIRDCENCHVVLMCQQFRTRDCKNLDVVLFCQTQPIIEESVRIRFACIQLRYSQIQEHLEAAGLSVFNNKWSNIHDFTPAQENYSYLSENTDQMGFVPFAQVQEKLNNMAVSCSVSDSVVPLTLGLRQKSIQPEALVMCFSGADSLEALRRRCLQLIKHLHNQKVELVNCIEIQMTSQDLERILGTHSGSFIDPKSCGHVVSMEWSVSISEICVSVTEEESWRNRVYIVEGELAKQQLRKLKTFTDMQQSV